jgi:hypothetical protein
MVKKAREYEVTKRDEFPERVRRYPELQARMEALLDVVENASGDVVKADEAEERVVEEIRPMGQEALQAWAERKQRRVEAEYERRRDMSRKEKKALLAHPIWTDRRRGANLSARTNGAPGAALLRIDVKTALKHFNVGKLFFAVPFCQDDEQRYTAYAQQQQRDKSRMRE